ncbi:RHS repeat domain-containing protein [Halopseudomonas yangmingensis]|uniref:RHS repeat domain-containing protein n=1 Tax=Halopseudomonas yangmingensis TaxID=1720063 RepID=UPI002481EC87|nr:RHS repeat-associated core domain-containing protein [Halopseudomonas yangmingensis]
MSCWAKPSSTKPPVAALDSSEQDATPQIAWLHSDHLLTARAATDANQNLIWRWRSDAFGVGEAESLTATNNPAAPNLTLNLRFPGQYHDEESGLYYNYFRTYDPSMGRYTQSDPIGLMGGVNTFGYVAGNPIARFDPLGLLIVYPDNDPDFKRDVELARQYLPLLDQYFRELDMLDAELHLIRIGRGDNPRFQEELLDIEPCGTPSAFSEPSSIFWNPREGNKILDGTGSIQSPALILLHEFAHAHQYMTNFDAYDRDKRNLRNDGYTDDEEYRVITGPETTAATAAGEPTRTCHRFPDGDSRTCTAAEYNMQSVTHSLNGQ